MYKFSYLFTFNANDKIKIKYILNSAYCCLQLNEGLLQTTPNIPVLGNTYALDAGILYKWLWLKASYTIFA